MSIDVTWPIKKSERELALRDLLKQMGIRGDDADLICKMSRGAINHMIETVAYAYSIPEVLRHE